MAVLTSPENLPAWRRSGTWLHGQGSGSGRGAPVAPVAPVAPGRAGQGQGFLGKTEVPKAAAWPQPPPEQGQSGACLGVRPSQAGVEVGALVSRLASLPPVHFHTTRFLLFTEILEQGRKAAKAGCALVRGTSIPHICPGLTHLPPTKAAAILTLPPHCPVRHNASSLFLTICLHLLISSIGFHSLSVAFSSFSVLLSASRSPLFVLSLHP